VSERYRRSEEWLARAMRTIPLGSQTFSKSPTHLPVGAAPLYAERAEGARIWDLDGRVYVDFTSALAAVLLGYRDPDVDAAIREQLDRGISFSLPHPLEAQVAEMLVERIPCAERVRFGKNGSDATTAAIRLARAHTGRERVVVCGYHGWHDWYIASTSRDRGVPASTRALTHAFPYDDLDALDAILARHGHEVAAVILEPMAATPPAPGFLEGVRDRAAESGALLVFDETVTGFRFHRGGAQALFGVTPDLATFGKGLANGLPLSAVVGTAALMRGMEEIFFSTTFGGETLSLAAARAVLEKLDREPVLARIAERGEAILAGVERLVARHDLEKALAVSGHPAWSFLHVAEDGIGEAGALRTLFLQEVFARGVLTLGTHNLSYAHSAADVELLLGVYDEVFGILAEALATGTVRARLRCEPLRPLFRVRQAPPAGEV